MCTVLSVINAFYPMIILNQRIDFIGLIARITLVLTLIAVIIYILYIFKLHNNPRFAIIIPTLLGIFALQIILCVFTIHRYEVFCLGEFLDSYRFAYRDYVCNCDSLFIALLPILAISSTSILAIISVFKKNFNTKVLIIVSLSVGVLWEMLFLAKELIPTFIDVGHLSPTIFIYKIFESVGFIIFLVSLLLFTIKNTVSSPKRKFITLKT